MFRWQQADLVDVAEGHGAALASRGGSSRGGTVAAERKRTKNEPLLKAVHRLEQADPPLSPGEILDHLLPDYGRDYDPNEGDDYERAKDALRKKIERARRAIDEQSADE